MSRSRFKNLDTERRQRLFDSAAEEFGAKGYDGASLNRIIERSGMSKSSLYYYFEDKADLFTTLVERSMTFLFKELGGFDIDTLTADTYWSELEAFYQRCIAVVNENAWYVKLGRVFYHLRDHPNRSAPTQGIFDAGRRWIGKLIIRGQQLGVVRVDLPMSMLVDSAMGLGEALDRWTVEHWDELDEKIVPEQVALFRRLLEP